MNDNSAQSRFLVRRSDRPDSAPHALIEAEDALEAALLHTESAVLDGGEATIMVKNADTGASIAFRIALEPTARPALKIETLGRREALHR